MVGEDSQEQKSLSFNKKFSFLFNRDEPIVVLQGGTGSGKTQQILRFFIIKAVSGAWNGLTVDIVRRTFPAMRISTMKDFEDILKEHDLYSSHIHNKTENSYRIGGCLFRFYSADDEQRMRGPRRDIAYFNEVLEFKYMDFQQIMMRTNRQVFCDYNPSEERHWFYEKVLERDDVFFDKSAFIDNPFLPAKVRQEIRTLKNTAPNLWKIYGKGERGVNHATIFTTWEYAEEPYEKCEGEELLGMDFGFNNPTTLVRVKYTEKEIVVDELLYKTELTSDQIVEELRKLRDSKMITTDSTITADSARPEILDDIRYAGFNIHGTKKGKSSVLEGINFMKQKKIYITKNSTNTISEFRGYKWKVDKNEIVRESPEEVNDHTIDAVRYALEAKMRGGVFIGSIKRGR